MKLREIHIWDLPKDKISVKLDDSFRNKFFNILKKECGSDYQHHREFNYNRGSFSKWRLGKEFILLEMLHKMSNFLIKKGYDQFNEKKIEKHITYLKSIGAPNNKVISNPKLPIKEDKRLVKLVAHFLADGYEGEVKENWVKGGSYCNTRKELINDFKNCLTVFGEVPIRIWKYKQKGAELLFFPATITYILKHIYNIDTFLTKKSRIPKFIFEISDELKYHFLAVFIDDEFTVYDSYINLLCANKQLVEGIKRLFESLNFETSDIKIKQKKYFLLKIYDINKIKNIPLQHKKKKETVFFSLMRNKKNRGYGEIKGKLLKDLGIKIYTAKDLARKHGIHEQTMRRHLRDLKIKNLIKCSQSNNTNYWELRRKKYGRRKN